MGATAARAAAGAALRAGVSLSAAQASAIATAVLTHADTEISLLQMAWHEEWLVQGYRDHVRASMRHDLWKKLTDEELLPVTLPAETVTYHADLYPGDVTGPQVPEDGPWTTARILLRVPVRRARGRRD